MQKIAGKSFGVAIATYNGEKYLRELLDSIDSQKIKPSMICISDDASSDNTLGVVKEFSMSTDIPIKVLSSSERVGVINNFSRAFQGLDTDYIVYCDQDDVWESSRLSTCASIFADTSISLVFHQSRVVDSQLGYIDTAPKSFPEGVYKFPYYPDYIWGFGHQMIFRRDVRDVLFALLVQSKKNGKLPQNFDLLVLIAAGLAGSIYFVSKELINFRRHAGATSPAGIKTVFDDESRNVPSRLMRMTGSINKTLAILDDLLQAELLVKNSVTEARFHAYLEHIGKLHLLYSKRSSAYAARSRLFSIALILEVFLAGGYGTVRRNKLPYKYFLLDLFAALK